MTRLTPFALALALPGVAAAAPLPKDPPATPITVENANQVRRAFEVDRAANRIVRGPNRGALVVFDWKAPAEVLDDRTLKPLAPFLKGQAPHDIAITRDGKLVAFTG